MMRLNCVLGMLALAVVIGADRGPQVVMDRRPLKNSITVSAAELARQLISLRLGRNKFE